MTRTHTFKQRWTSTALFLSFILLLSALPALSQKKVACIGDSVTEGYGIDSPAIYGYPAVLQSLLGAGYEVRNFGNSGSTLLRSGHKPYYKQKQFAEALDFHADIAVIHLGLNDTDPRNYPHYRGDFVRDYVWLIDTLLSSNPRMEIYVCSMTPIFTAHHRFTSSTQAWQAQLQQEIRKVVSARNTHFIDLFEAFRHRPDLINDRWTLHPDRKGAAHLAKTVYGYLTGKYGHLTVAPSWSSHMVLQKDKIAILRGTADAGSRITVQWRGQQYKSVVSTDGKWQVSLPTGEMTKKGQKLTIKSGKETITYDDILVGQVWLAMGQSNMVFTLSQTNGGADFAKAHASQSLLRLMPYRPIALTEDKPWTAEQLQRANDLNFFEGEWHENSETEALGFSALGYAFGSELQSDLDEPVGIIELAVGGSPLISWISRETLLSKPQFHAAFNNWRNSDYLMAWCRERASVNCGPDAGKFQRHSYEPSFNHEAAVRYLDGIPVAGILWYQGESDAENAELHAQLFPLFVQDLRTQFGADTPIEIIQLSSINRPSWGWFRASQLELSQSIANSDIVVSHDLGDPQDVHPRTKLPLAHRLAQVALSRVYHPDDPSGLAPIPMSIKMKGGNGTLVIDSHGRGLTTSDGLTPRGFALLTLDGKTLPIEAIIIDGNIAFTIPQGISATHLVYAWEPFSDANVIQAGGQPLPTFSMPLSGK